MTEYKKAFSQMEKIRNSGKTNMFDAKKVQRVASKKGFHELVLKLGGDPWVNYDEFLRKFKNYLGDSK